MGLMNRKRDEAWRVMMLDYKCCTPKRYEEWRAAARASRPSPSVWFCVDCTPAYQGKMLSQGRCVRPEIRFKLDEDGGYVGFVPFLTNDMKE